VDKHCIVLMARLPSQNDMIRLPDDYHSKILHITMLLNRKPHLYSNKLTSRLLSGYYKIKPHELLLQCEEPSKVQGRIEFNY
jgi:hypothetical protein